ncbi:hypothetical protein BDW02DRAFT_569386 [Decorospora gaudefroyi]|uniref:F-box domain-containing protein n=1 Tax=Decorospora gaudefroyi TaxID=184978 RepID=A0A6A5KCP6_9PLEO|nr:hypothetical protein BDW02DRAFT_569386 [Decorospora gaudefroyi]
MDVLPAAPSQLARKFVPRAVAYRIDKHCHSRALERLYSKRLFSSSIQRQPHSPILSLPTEIRLIIYAYIFLSQQGKADRWSTVRPILLTCRLMYEEAIVMALQRTYFRFQSPYQPKKTRVLGRLQQHLRYVNIGISLYNFAAHGSNNPFILSDLPLHLLVINFNTRVHWTWSQEKTTYYRLISAILYRERREYDSLFGKNKHRLMVATKQYRPQREALYNTVAAMKAKCVNVRCAGLGDILWSAFVYFSLVSERATIVRDGDPISKEYRFHGVYDEGDEGFAERFQIVFDENFDLLRMGSYQGH